MPDDYTRVLTAELAAHGVTQYRVERSHTHPRLVFDWQGKSLFYVMPSSASDRRGPTRALSDLRKLLGVSRIIRKSGRPKRRRNQTAASTALQITVRADPLAALGPLLDGMVVREAAKEREARHAGLTAYLAGLGDHPPADVPDHLCGHYRAGWWDGHMECSGER